MYPGALAVTVAVMAATVAIAWYARRYSGSTLEFYLAGRTVNVFTNASAICGDYFSAASFLGVAGAVYASGMDGLWFGIGFAAGFVPVLLFLASPLRRFGEYTLPDFLAARFRSDAARLAGVAMVQLIALFYLAPQMVGAGTIWELLVGKGLPGLSPYATGVAVTALVMIVYTAVGGMRGTTWNQAVQFWIMVWAVAVLLLLGLLTLKGALAGMLAGGGGAVTLLALNVLRVLGSLPSHPWLDFLGQVTFPTLFTVPLAFATIFLVSFLDRRNIPDNLDEVWLRVHGTARERQERLLMRAAAAPRRRRGPATPP